VSEDRPRDGELASAVARQLGAEPTSAREIVGQGSVNRVFVVSLAGGARWVVRFVRDSLDAGHYAEEAWCLRAAARHGLPVPELVGVGSAFGTPFLVQAFVDGESAAARRDPGLWRTLGGYARVVSGIALDEQAPEGLFVRFGRDCRASWAAHVRYNVEQLTPDDPLIGLGVYDGADQSRLSDCFEALVQRVTQFGLTHGDLVPRNVLIPARGAPTLIDWGSARVGSVPFLDYLRIWADEAREGFTRSELAAFAEGYGVAPEPLLDTMADIHVLSRIDLVRWALDRRPDRVTEIAARSQLAVRGWLASRGE
jgi:aminoglycoside phosphotransferase (APT) family kinase protein